MKLYIILLILLLASNISLQSQTDPYTMVERMGRGINLGNVLSAPTEGNWAAVVEEQYFIDVATAGFTNVRIPIDFFGTRTSGDTSGYSSAAGTSADYGGTSADYRVSTTDLDRIQQVVEWSLNQGLVTIIDFHGSNLKSEFIDTFDFDETEYTDPTSAKRAADNEKFRAIWTQVADRFKNHSENLLFEVINEPYFHMGADEMDALNTDILAIIRGSGGSNGTRNIIITGGGATSHNAPLQIKPSIISENSYLIATFHYYQPFDFTSSSSDARDVESWGTVADKSILTDRFDEVATWALTNDLPIFLGEFGADNTGGYNYSSGDLNDVSGNETGYADGGPDNTSRVAYHSFIAEQAINRGFSFAAWDAGPKSNKTIHMRTDSSASVNYDIDYFSVSTYNPKVTTKSTVLDNATWVEDVKNALFESGTWPLSNNAQKTENYLINGDFETWTNQSKLSSWILNNNSGDASTLSQTQASDNIVRNSTTSAKFVTTSSGKGILQTSSPITIDTAGKYFFGVWIKSTDPGNIKLGLKLQDGLTTTYPGNVVTIPDSDWHYYVYHADLRIGDQVNPRLIPQGSGIFYIDGANFSEGLGGANVEWDTVNGTATTYADFWITQDYGGSTNGTLSENTNTTYVKSGYNSLSLVTSADASNLKRGVIVMKNNENQGNRYVHPAATRKYQVVAWVYATNAANIVLNVKADGNNTTDHSIRANTWTQIFSDIIELDRGDFGTEVYPKIEFKTPSTIHYVDDVYLNWGGNTWNGSTSIDWHTASNWTPNMVPGENSQVTIPNDVSNYPTTSSDVTVGSVNMAAGSSLIAQSIFSGTITYTRTIETTNWHLISSPVVGQDIDAFVSDHSLATGGSKNIGLGDYNTSTLGWTYYQSGTSGAGYFTSGDGRAIKLASEGELSFTGTIDVNDSGVGIAITTNFDGYNLIGNPYPSYIAVNNSADNTNNILKLNDTANDYLREATLWIWNQSTDSYDPINHASAATYIAPAQGFFVRSNGSHSFSFTEAMQSHQSSDSFQRPSTRPEIKLTLRNGRDTRNADIFYIDGTTTGWDNGYDSTLFAGVANDTQIYTHLVSNSQGQDLGIQSLPNTNFENMVIPIGINAVSGTAITINAATSNFPIGMNVFLEDKEDNSYTLLDTESNYGTTLERNQQGIGRFYLHITTATLGEDDVSHNTPISIYLLSKENLRIVGVQNGTANVYVYNMIGKEVLSTSFEGQGINDVPLPNIPEAVYIVKLRTQNETLNKKIIIR